MSTPLLQGPSGAWPQRWTPASVEDALTVGNGIGQELAASAGLPDVLPEPSSLSVCAISLLALTRLRRRRALAA